MHSSKIAALCLSAFGHDSLKVAYLDRALTNDYLSQSERPTTATRSSSSKGAAPLLQYDSVVFPGPGSIPRETTSMVPKPTTERLQSDKNAYHLEELCTISAYAADFHVAEFERTRRQAVMKPAERLLGE